MIKNIVFDFGGVLLNLDTSLTYEALTDVTGIDLTGEIPSNILKVLLGYEKGEINTETFLWNLQKESKKLTPQAQELIKAWNAMLLGWNPERFTFLKELKKKYKTYILSNTNELHIEWVMRDLNKTHGIKEFESQFFNRIFYSHQMNKRKPEIEIYDQLIEEAKLIPSETLFIDDNQSNVDAAKNAGWRAVLHDPESEIIDMLPIYLKDF